MPATVTPIRRDRPAAADALAALDRFLDRSALSANTIRAYLRQARAHVDWLTLGGRHADAFDDEVGARAAVEAWRKHLLVAKASPATVNQALAAVLLMYEVGARLQPKKVTRAKVAKPGAPDSLTVAEENAARRHADRRSPRDAAIVHLLLDTGARVEECARLDVVDVPITARTGSVRLLGKGTQVRTNPLPSGVRERLSAWLDVRAGLPGARGSDQLWIGQRGPMSIEGITKVVLAVGTDAKQPGLRPHRLRHTYATRLREGGADPAQIQKLMGHASIETTQRYFRASDEEVAALVERVFG